MGGIHHLCWLLPNGEPASQEWTRRALETALFRCGQRELGLRRGHASGLLCRPLPSLPILRAQSQRQYCLQDRLWSKRRRLYLDRGPDAGGGSLQALDRGLDAEGGSLHAWIEPPLLHRAWTVGRQRTSYWLR